MLKEILFSGLAFGLVGCALTADAQQSTFESNVNRPGSDITRVNVASASDCANACLRNGDCHSWTMADADGRCWLKYSVPHYVQSNGFTSGVIYAGPHGYGADGHCVGFDPGAYPNGRSCPPGWRP
jgi:PAN domain